MFWVVCFFVWVFVCLFVGSGGGAGGGRGKKFFFCVLNLFLSNNHRGFHIPSSWMVHAGCVSANTINPSRT